MDKDSRFSMVILTRTTDCNCVCFVRALPVDWLHDDWTATTQLLYILHVRLSILELPLFVLVVLAQYCGNRKWSMSSDCFAKNIMENCKWEGFAVPDAAVPRSPSCCTCLCRFFFTHSSFPLNFSFLVSCKCVFVTQDSV